METTSFGTFDTAEQAALTEARQTGQATVESLEEALYDMRRAQQSLHAAFKEVNEQDTVEIAELEVELAELRDSNDH